MPEGDEMSDIKGWEVQELVQNIETSTGTELKLPKGCLGLLFIFKTKKAAREHCGKDATLTRASFKIKGE